MKITKISNILPYLLSSFVIIVFSILMNNIIEKNTRSKRDFSHINQEGILNVVTEYNLVNYCVSGDTITGLQYDLCKYIERRSGLTVNIFLENNLEICVKKLENNTYDVIAHNIPITNENRKILSFTVPIALGKQVLVQRQPAPGDTVFFIRNQIDLAGKEVYVSQNSSSILRLRNLSEEIAEPIYVKEMECTTEQLIYMVASKEIDYAVLDKELAMKNSVFFPEIDIETDISFTQLQAWAVRKTSPVLLDSLNVWISDFKNNVKKSNK
ncbi:MAG: transporter substrate-binding domain-containing protein [Dysgonamonadaceae bacterium]|jgi:membrane-bound lytic murein transglycosylase MltF|nr:transporter substrate-binding domain-containing protein [Dysgonamonadaceae bacterium]